VKKAESSVGLDCGAGSKILSKILSPCHKGHFDKYIQRVRIACNKLSF